MNVYKVLLGDSMSAYF